MEIAGIEIKEFKFGIPNELLFVLPDKKLYGHNINEQTIKEVKVVRAVKIDYPIDFSEEEYKFVKDKMVEILSDMICNYYWRING